MWTIFAILVAWNIAIFLLMRWVYLATARPSLCPKCSRPYEGHDRDGSGICWCQEDA